MVKFSFITWKIDISTQKIDGSILETYKIVIVGFLV